MSGNDLQPMKMREVALLIAAVEKLMNKCGQTDLIISWSEVEAIVDKRRELPIQVVRAALLTDDDGRGFLPETIADPPYRILLRRPSFACRAVAAPKPIQADEQEERLFDFTKE
jgi:hypothetical protein